MVRAYVQVVQSLDSIKTGVRQKTNAAARQPRFGHIGKVLIDTIRGVCEESEGADPGTHSRGAKMPIRLRWHTNERAVGTSPHRPARVSLWNAVHVPNGAERRNVTLEDFADVFDVNLAFLQELKGNHC